MSRNRTADVLARTWQRRSNAPVVGLLLAATQLFGGCASSTVAPAESPTHGIALTMLVRNEGSANQLFIVEPDGAIQWGGGFDAVDGNPSWTGTLSGKEADELVSVMRTHGWLDGHLRADAPAKWPIYEIKVRTPEGSHSSDFKGSCAQVTPVLAVLERIADRRNDAYLNTFPEPGRQRR
jgi:hypothetical protein